ncbi:hypothetical protein QUF84_21065 [Fictibacillus enclensis]|uniref:hypothetical protein n=1 Tax=Fictibacillus enclensis TaxID=1017270 RepID=UPI0025A0A0A0|nr:hypothetical protein [Fictibacillus enclensis]MDM5339694.1 hypothetical protein [Fictibacillus enclensis]
MKTTTINFRDFLNGDNGEKKSKSLIKPVLINAAIYVAIAPTIGFAADPDTFGTLYHTGLKLADWLCVGTLMFGGGMWMLGNRTKALEYVLSTVCGYIVIRHAIDIRDFLARL